MNKNVRAMVEGAVTVALSVVLLFIMLYTPLGAFAFFVVPIPYIIYSARHNWKQSIGVGVISTIVAVMFLSVFITPLVLYGWVVGFVSGISFARKDSGVQTILIGSVTILALFLLALVVSIGLFQVNLVDEMIRFMDEIFAQTNQMMGQTFSDTFRGLNIADLIKLYFPSLLVINALFLGFINYWIGYGLHKRLGNKPRPFPPLAELRFPRSIIYYYLVAMGIALIPGLTEISWIKVSVLNILPVLDLILTVQGILFVFYVAKVRNMGRGLPILSIVLLFIPTVAYILKIIGLVDLAIDIRGKLTPRS